jgi:hypothetical protein
MEKCNICQNPLIEQPRKDASLRQSNRSHPWTQNCLGTCQKLRNQPIAETQIGGEAPVCPRLATLRTLKKITRWTAVGRLRPSALSCPRSSQGRYRMKHHKSQILVSRPRNSGTNRQITNQHPRSRPTHPYPFGQSQHLARETNSEIASLPDNYQVAGKHPATRFDSLHTKPARLLSQAVRLPLHVPFLWAGRGGRAARLAGLV